MGEMREILFRGRVTSTGEWRTGCFCMGYSSRAVPIPFIGQLNHRGTVVFVSVDPETVGQFTGAYDETGTPVFEGDILETNLDDGDTARLVIRYEDMQFCGFDPDVPAEIDDEVFISEELIAKYYKVKGNIFDNPELLEGRT